MDEKTLNKKVNHPFRYIYKFICYDLNFYNNDVVMDLEDFSVALKVNKNERPRTLRFSPWESFWLGLSWHQPSASELIIYNSISE